MGTFQSLWVGDPPSPYQQMAMKSFIDHGHAYRLYTYRDYDLPEGVQRCDANDILPESAAFRQVRTGIGQGSYAGFSDLFRYALLLKRGGWWVDADVVCLSPDVEEPELFFGWQDEEVINGAILRAPPGHPLIRELDRAAQEKRREAGWGAFGPNLLTEMICGSAVEDRAAPAAVAYPIHWREALHLLLPDKAQEVRGKIGAAPLLHLWHEMMRQGGVLQWAGPPPGSVMAELFIGHGVPIREPVYSADEMSRLARNLSAATSAGKIQRQVKRLAAELDAVRAERDRLAAALDRQGSEPPKG